MAGVDIQPHRITSDSEPSLKLIGLPHMPGATHGGAVKVRRLLSLIAIVATSFVGRDLAAQATDVIRGKVTGPDSLPIAGVTVTATSISGNVSRNTKSDKSGNFSISFPNGD